MLFARAQAQRHNQLRIDEEEATQYENEANSTVIQNGNGPLCQMQLHKYKATKIKKKLKQQNPKSLPLMPDGCSLSWPVFFFLAFGCILFWGADFCMPPFLYTILWQFSKINKIITI